MNAVYEWREAPEARYAVIGNPISHSLSPTMHAAIYRELELDWRYIAVRVPEGEVGMALDHLKSLGFRGVNVTVPHKLEVLSWAELVDPFARKVQAANTVSLTGRSCINTDAPGFMDTLHDLEFKGRSVLVLGAGGSARALVAILSEYCRTVKIYNRTASKAEELAALYGAEAVTDADPTGMDLILNSTSSAFDSEAPPVRWENAESHALAYDLMYSKSSTPFLRAAQERGLRTVDGLPLLVAQGARSFEWWTNLEAPRAVMMAAIRDL